MSYSLARSPLRLPGSADTDVMCYGATDVMRGYFAVWSESSLDLTD